jgi:hypothetical protein
MRIVRILRLACIGVAILSARPAHAQSVRDVVIHLHRAGDTVSVRNATVVIDHTYEAGKTDSTGTLKLFDLEDGGHVIEGTADGYNMLYDTFNTGSTIRQPIEIEVFPHLKKPDAPIAKRKTTNHHF